MVELITTNFHEFLAYENRYVYTYIHTYIKLDHSIEVLDDKFWERTIEMSRALKPLNWP